jgi:hypothetical protein
MTAVLRAQVLDDYNFAMGGISFRIALLEIGENGFPIRTIRILRRSEDGGAYCEWYTPTDEDRMALPTGTDRSVFHLPEGCGEALLEALTRHYDRGVTNADARAYKELLKHESERRDAPS